MDALEMGSNQALICHHHAHFEALLDALKGLLNGCCYDPESCGIEMQHRLKEIAVARETLANASAVKP